MIKLSSPQDRFYADSKNAPVINDRCKKCGDYSPDEPICEACEAILEAWEAKPFSKASVIKGFKKLHKQLDDELEDYK